MSFAKLKSNLWELTAYGKTFIGTSKKDCLKQFEQWRKNRAFDYSTGLPLE